MTTPGDWHAKLVHRRKQKDGFFAEERRSPIPPGAREGFDGLDYFAPNSNFRFEVDLDEHDEKERVVVETTTDGEREYIRWGEFTFEVDGEAVTLQAYKAHPEEDRFWVPFRDATNGEETYAAGRYLDVEPPEDLTDDGRWVLDFNKAYNPYCAYSHAYECPLIPTENWLDVPIEAGERVYDAEDAYDPEEGGHDHGHGHGHDH